MRLNTKRKLTEQTHEGGPAYNIPAEQALRRAVCACLLWERGFYENGLDIAERILDLCKKVPAETVAVLATEARSTFNLRHVPLLLLCGLTQNAKGHIVGNTIAETIQRADELTEILAIYWRNGKRPLSKQMKVGLAKAFRKFDEYHLAKYNRDNAVKLRDVLFMVHAKPKDGEQAEMWKRLVEGKLKVPDTWETNLSAGEDKKATFERLIREGNLGYLAVLRNLRNMVESGVDEELIRNAILARKGAKRVLPFRYVAAARACPQLEPVIDAALCEAISEMPLLEGKTAILVDVSASMNFGVSGKSQMTYMDAAASLASVIHGDLRVFTFSHNVVEVPPRRGMAGVDAIIRSQAHSGTYLGGAVETINKNVTYDRLIVITDEQSHDLVGGPKGKGYMINVATNENGVGYGPWTHIDGFSEGVLRFIHESERTG